MDAVGGKRKIKRKKNRIRNDFDLGSQSEVWCMYIDTKSERIRRGERERMRPGIVIFGDSITQQSFRTGGWGASLADTYSRKVPFQFNSTLSLSLSLFLFFYFIYFIKTSFLGNNRLMYWFVGMVDTTLDGLCSCCLVFSLW